jgi:5-methylcytosine-specific restriction endonuclease McrA
MKNLLLATILSLYTLVSISATIQVPTSAIRTTDVYSICNTKTSTIRSVSLSTKKEVYRRAGIIYGERTLCTKGYEVDHRVALQAGGSNAISNLQLQAYCTKSELAKNFPATVRYDARAKDSAESKAHTAICSGKVDVKGIQANIYNWSND